MMTETPSPYRTLLHQLALRIWWDLRPAAWISRARLKAIKNRETGRRAVIMCNGPSLLKTDFDLVRDSGAFVIGLNKINLLFDKTDLRPDAIVAVNRHVIEQNADFFNSTEIPLFLSKVAIGRRKFVPMRKNITYLYPFEGYQRPTSDVTQSVLIGATVTTVAMQLALHLGCREIALVGCDHNFATKGPAHQAVKAGDEDPNHFDPRYFAGGVTWQLPDLTESELFYSRTAELAHTVGGRIVNATDGGKLEVFERQDLADFLGS